MFRTFGSVHNTKNKLDGLYAWVRYNNRKQTRWKYLGCSRSSLTAALWLCCFGYSSSLRDCMNGQEDDQYFRTLGMGSIVGMTWREGREREPSLVPKGTIPVFSSTRGGCHLSSCHLALTLTSPNISNVTIAIIKV